MPKILPSLSFTSIRQRILFVVLIPSVVFYLFVTVVCLYFSYYSVCAEVRGRYIQEALYAGAVIDSNIRELTSLAELLKQSVLNENKVDGNQVHTFLNSSSVAHKSILGVGAVCFKDEEKVFNYWLNGGDGFVKKEYDKYVSFQLSERISNIYNEGLMGVYWYTDSETDFISQFRSSLVLFFKVGGCPVVIHIDVDGQKLASSWPINNCFLPLDTNSVYKEIIEDRSDEVDLIDSRVHFCKRFTLRDAGGLTIFSTGRSAKKYRSLNEKVEKMSPINGVSDFLTYNELNSLSLFGFFLANQIKKLNTPFPNSILLDLVDKVVDSGEIVHFRFSIRDGWKVWCTAIPLKTSGWILSVYLPEKEILNSVYKQFVICFIASTVAILFILLSLWFIAGRIVEPVKKLKDSVIQYVKDIEPKALFEESKNEVNSLRESFNKLTVCLDERGKALNDARVNNISHLTNQLHGRYFYFTLDCNGVITHVSPSIRSVLGCEACEFNGKFEQYLVNDTVKGHFQSKLYDIFEGEWHDAFEIKMRHFDGSIRCVELFFCLMPGIKTRQKAVEGMANDVTERVIDTEKFKSLIASAPDAVVITNEKGDITLINHKVSELLGFMSSELVNKPFSILFPEKNKESIPLLENLDVSRPDRHKLEGYECSAQKKNRDIFPVEISSSVINTSQGCLVSVVIRDISERKMIESELITAKENAENSDRSKTLFLSNMSHELRTPLNGVLGYSQILINDNNLSDFYKSKVRSMEKCGRHLLKLINNVLDIAKLENDSVDIESKPFNLISVIDEVRLIVVNSVKDKGLDLHITVDENVPVYIVGDKLKIRQVLINLTSNAVKFTDSGYVSISLMCDNGIMKFSVEDSGVGISDEDKDKLFVSFSQLAAGRKQGGAGLGLAISYSLVKIMGGELYLESQEERGSCFCFSLPCITPTDQSLPGQNPYTYTYSLDKKSLHKKVTLLVVEDSISNREQFADILSNVGFTVYQAGDSGEALDLCRKYKFDLVLMNVKTPVLDGYSASKMIRGLPGQSKQKMIAITASGDGGCIKYKNNEEAGFCDCLEKPFDVDELVLKIYRCLDSDGEFLMNASEKVIHDHSVNETDLCAIVTQVSEMLEIGDVDAIATLALKWQNSGDYGCYPGKLLAFCESYDVNALEAFVKELSRDK